MRLKKVLSISVLVFFLGACATASFVKNSYNTLTVSKESYTAVFSIAGDLYSQGKLTTEQKDKIIELGKIYKKTHNEAVLALLNYEKSKSLPDREFYLSVVEDLATRLYDLVNYIKPLMDKEE